ncbi:MAG TPA: peptidylprolyl isomerase [Spirochaetia bacterium]|nr:peptidylprolyl isomerase [Spirochaetia bacterium]
MVGPFEEATKRLSHGSLSDVVSTQFGYHIIKLTGRKD